MIYDAAPYSDALIGDSKKTAAERAFVDFFERRLGAQAIIRLETLPYSRLDLLEPFLLAKLLSEKGVIRSFSPAFKIPDEPPLKIWKCLGGDAGGELTGGASLSDDKIASMAALAEGLERHIRLTQTDYFPSPKQATVAQISKLGIFVPPIAFASFSEEQRKVSPRWFLPEDAQYLWIQAHSLVTQQRTYIPAQIVSAAMRPRDTGEPLIRQQTTCGLATWPSLIGARLAGALELIEREAFMIMWFNQFTYPRLALSSILGISKNLDDLIRSCAQYRLKIHVIPMMTDVPTHAICVILEDESGAASEIAPRFTFGLRAHSSLPYAIEKATEEALRARLSYRGFFLREEVWDTQTPIDSIGHRERIFYWGIHKNAERLTFLLKGKELPYSLKSEWENDSPEQHLGRIIKWCKNGGHEFLSVSLGKSAANPTPWHIEMAVIPDLIPTHLHEKFRHLGGARIKDVPQMFGFTPLETPFVDAPHPFF